MTTDEQAILLRRLRQEFAQILGPRLERLILYGSRARGDARPDSDVDVLVVVNGELNYWGLLDMTLPSVASLSLEYDTVVSPVFASLEQFVAPTTPLLINIQHEGITL